jgi:diguanylate cyclase (GGDEF)-like protein
MLSSYLASPDLVFAYIQDDQGQWREQRAGDLVAVADWPLPDVRPVFRIDPRPDAEQTVYVRVSDRLGSFTRLRLSRLDTWSVVHQRNDLAFGAYFGLTLLVFGMSLACWVGFRDSIFASYAAYSLCMILAQASFSGLAGVVLFPNLPLLNDFSIHLWISLATTLGLLFALHASSAFALVRRWVAFSLVCCGAIWLMLMVFAINRSTPLFLILNAADGLIGLMVIVTLAITWRMGERYSVALLLAFSPLLLGAVPLLLYNYRLIGSSFWTQYSLMLGSAFESVVLFFVVVRRSRNRAVTQTRTRALEKFDALTGLANARTLADRLDGMQTRAMRAGNACGLVLVELVNYRQIGTELGRDKADLALVLSARHMGLVARDFDTAARVGESLFALAIEGPVTEASLAATCSTLAARGLRQQRLLTGGETLDFMMVHTLVRDKEMPSEKILQWLTRRLREHDTSVNRRIYGVSLDAAHSVPAFNTEPFQQV